LEVRDIQQTALKLVDPGAPRFLSIQELQSSACGELANLSRSKTSTIRWDSDFRW